MRIEGCVKIDDKMDVIGILCILYVHKILPLEMMSVDSHIMMMSANAHK